MSTRPTETEVQQMRVVKTASKQRFVNALNAARHRFAPANLRDEMVDKVVDTALEIGDQGLQIAKRNKGKLAIAATVTGAFLARRPLIKIVKSSSQKAKTLWVTWTQEK